MKVILKSLWSCQLIGFTAETVVSWNAGKSLSFGQNKELHKLAISLVFLPVG